MKKLNRATAVCVMTVVLGTQSPALADETPAPTQASNTAAAPDVEIAGADVATADETIVVGNAQIEAARDEAVADAQEEGLSAADEALVDELVTSVEAEGGVLDEESVDVVPLLGGDVTLTVPVDVDVDKVTIDISEGDVAVTSVASETDEPTGLPRVELTPDL